MKACGLTLSALPYWRNLQRSGRSVSSAGDINGDGTDDLIIGAFAADPHGNSAAGKTCVVFGEGGLGDIGRILLSDLDDSNGFVINGIDVFDNSGRTVSSAGDINDDGTEDLIIGARRASPNTNDEAGELRGGQGEDIFNGESGEDFLSGGGRLRMYAMVAVALETWQQ